MKYLLRFLIFLFLLIGSYFIFPKKSTGPITLEYPTLPTDLAALDQQINDSEAKVKDLRPDNQARIVWANDSLKEKTPYSLVYLHGFSASQYEGFPTHRQLAEKYGMNLFLARLSHHGIKGKNAFDGLTADGLMDSAMDAIAVGKAIGEKVILLSTSTGGTVALPAMAHDPEIEAGIFYSPNIDIVDQNTHLMRRPFGLDLAEYIVGSKYHKFDGPSSIYKHWTNEYSLEAIVTLRELLDKTMTEETFSKVIQPVLVLGYYENEEKQDPVVLVSAMEEMVGQLGTEPSKKVFKKIGSVGDHVMACESHSKDLGVVMKETTAFIEGVLGIVPTGSN